MKSASSEPRRRAGQKKTESLAGWRQDFTAARTALNEEGYKGSLKLNKDGPLYQKIQSIRQARLLSTAATTAASSAQQSSPACLTRTEGSLRSAACQVKRLSG